MGTKNKERRRARQAKRRKDRQTHGMGRVPGAGDRRPGHGQASGIDSEAVEWAVFRAAHAGCDRATAGDRQPMLDLLGAGFGLPGGREVVARRLTVMLTVDLTSALDGGWGPDDLVQVVARRAGKAASAFAAGALTDAVRRSRAGRRGGAPAPAAQAGSEHLARSLDPSAGDWPAQLLAAVDAFAAVEHLPPLPDLGSLGAPSRTARSQEEERQLARVRALLAKAEASDFAAESETFMAKAQELMTRYCLDRTAVQGGSGSDPGAGPEVEGRRVWLEDPYLQAKGLLLGAVAAANRCRTVISSEIGFATVIGFGVDLDATELLFTSLLVQATQRLAALGREQGTGGRARRPSYRRSFLAAFASRIGERLQEANRSATAEADDALGNRLLPVLARRAADVDDAVERLFGELGTVDVATTDFAGWAAGAAAADLADLAVQDTLPFAAVS